MVNRIITIIVITLLAIISCKPKEVDVTPSQPEALSKTWEAPTQPNVDPDKNYKAIIKTAKGDITLELNPRETPLSVTNFIYLAKGGFYNGLTFHRVVPNFVIQGGDPTGSGAGGPGYTLPAEIKLPHREGALAWARQGDEVNSERRSSGSQFYITLAPTPFLDGAYTVFGQVVDGMDVVRAIGKGEVIREIVVE